MPWQRPDFYAMGLSLIVRPKWLRWSDLLSSMTDPIQARRSIGDKQKESADWLSLSPFTTRECGAPSDLRWVRGIILRAFTNSILRPEYGVRSTDCFRTAQAAQGDLQKSSSDRLEIPTLLNRNYICRILEFPKSFILMGP
jgi:hypothetical protein